MGGFRQMVMVKVSACVQLAADAVSERGVQPGPVWTIPQAERWSQYTIVTLGRPLLPCPRFDQVAGIQS